MDSCSRHLSLTVCVVCSEVELLTHAVTLFATNEWERNPSPLQYEALDKALDIVWKRFRAPLENTNVDCSVIQDEWDDMIDYGKRFLNSVQDDYWWSH